MERQEKTAMELYLKEIEYAPLLTPEEEIKYGRLARDGDELGRNTMITCNLRYVVKIAKRYMNQGVPFADLVQEGNLGLMHAVEKFDPERGFRFTTYATWWIRLRIERSLTNQSRTIRLPIHIVKKMNQYKRAVRDYMRTHGREPSVCEAAETLGMPVNKLQKLLAYTQKTKSLDRKMDDESDGELIDFIPDEDIVEAEEGLHRETRCHSLVDVLRELDPRQQEVLSRRFGLFGHEEATLEAVGKEIEIAAQNVGIMQMKALEIVRKKLAHRGLTLDTLL